jgi:hypothetical protein
VARRPVCKSLGALHRERRSVVRTDINLWDRIVLKNNLMSRPEVVLQHFKRCGVGALDQLACWQEIKRDSPRAAARITVVAAKMGIPVRLDDLLGDVLCDRPGEV